MALAYLPGVDHDIFISYCHHDDLSWIRGLYELLKPALREQLGVDANIWIDEKALERSGDFRAEIPARLSRSAILLILASNQYVRSDYCVNQECDRFKSQIQGKRADYSSDEFANAQFAFRLALLPVDRNDHYLLIPGLTDYQFHDGNFRFPLSSTAFQAEFGRLVVDISKLMKRMRNHRTKVFLYPRDATSGILEAHAKLKAELVANGYSVLPDSLVGLEDQAMESELGIFLLDGRQDPRMRPLMESFAHRSQKPWLVWESPSASASTDAGLRMFKATIQNRLASDRGRYFNAAVSAARFRDEVMDLLRPAARFLRPAGEKCRVALICDMEVGEELACADDIGARWSTEFEFELPGDAAAASAGGSDGVLLVWGKAKEAWVADQFERLSGIRAHKGLCVFDPEKRAVVQQIRAECADDWHITEHYGQFLPALLDTFFTRVRQSQSTGGRP